jgi:hypothetical protein
LVQHLGQHAVGASTCKFGGHRTVRTKGALSAKTANLMVFKLVNAAAKTWRRLKGENQLPIVVQGVKFQNGIEVIKNVGSPRRLIALVTQSPP